MREEEIRGTYTTDVNFEMVYKYFWAWLTTQRVTCRNILIEAVPNDVENSGSHSKTAGCCSCFCSPPQESAVERSGSSSISDEDRGKVEMYFTRGKTGDPNLRGGGQPVLVIETTPPVEDEVEKTIRHRASKLAHIYADEGNAPALRDALVAFCESLLSQTRRSERENLAKRINNIVAEFDDDPAQALSIIDEALNGKPDVEY